MATSNWREVLKAQYDDLQRLEDADKELDLRNVSANVDKLLQRPISSTSSSAASRASSAQGQKLAKSSSYHYSSPNMPDDHEFEPQPRHQPRPQAYQAVSDSEAPEEPGPPQYFPGNNSDEEGNMDHADRRNSRIGPNRAGVSIPVDMDDINDQFASLSRPQSARSMSGAGGGIGIDRLQGVNSPELSKGIDNNGRLQKAKTKMLEKQLDDANEMRRNLNDQVTDLQKQLKVEREENKKMKKRIQLLESDSRRSNRQSGGGDVGSAGESIEQLTQEINQLKKDLQTAERIAKQSEQTSKSKDTQIKRALETINRLKEQVSEQQQVQQNAAPVDRTQFEAFEVKIKTLEKQKLDLVAAFRKQMKLIDVLKRQKAHIEAARLLAFTEEEFMKTLDWAT